MTRILIAPDKFKGVLSAREVAEKIASGLEAAGAEQSCIEILPMADGGEGTADVLVEALGGEWRQCSVHDPLGRNMVARYGWIRERQLAVMEMSEAAGLSRLQRGEYDVDRASTYGVGEMMLHAVENGAQQIIIGLGGSATNDGGFGMARALGFRFLRRQPGGRRAPEPEIDNRVSNLRELGAIVPPEKKFRAQVIAAVDVRNPLLGKNGATRVFGPQKGASVDQLAVLDASLANLADVAAKEFGRDFRDVPGSGAAGGLGFGLMTFCGADLRSGFDMVAEAVQLRRRIQNVDLVITGEGKLDAQTPEGKTPAGVAGLAHSLGKKVYAIVGYADPSADAQSLFDQVWSVSSSDRLDPETIARAPQMLWERARQVASELGLTPD